MDDAITHALGIARKVGTPRGVTPYTGHVNQIEPVGEAREVQHLPGGHSTKIHVGPIHSPVAGRTDHLPAHVKNGSYVIPADIISGSGEGNTIAGFRIMRRVFGGVPYEQGPMPYGGHGGPYGEPLPHKASGGSISGIPVVVAGGEHILSPTQVEMAGDGDMAKGHEALDIFVKKMRAKIIKTMSKLPGPRRD